MESPGLEVYIEAWRTQFIAIPLVDVAGERLGPSP
jgi:hypothetical protein